MNLGSLLLQGGCFPALGVFGCCCSMGCEAVGTQCLSLDPCVSGLRRCLPWPWISSPSLLSSRWW